MADPHHATDAADHDAEAYQRGTMTIEEQTSTWKLVQALLSWGSLAIASLLLFLVIWFQPNGSFIGGFLAGVVVFVAGFFFLKSGSKGH
ncbi:MAG: aa3 type cytochrome c oxidase subunit [Brevundimonas sp.]|nr:aa3 type cytochrome c oxidase subunit [Brevundimonas sp.]